MSCNGETVKSGDLIECYIGDRGAHIAYDSDPTVYGRHKAVHVKERLGMYIESSEDGTWYRILFPLTNQLLWLSSYNLVKHAKIVEG